MRSQHPPVAPTTADLQALGGLAELFTSLADSVQQSIASRPMVGIEGSPFDLDFASETREQRSLLAFAVPGALGLLQGIRGNARALALLYSNVGPPFMDPAPFELMRGIWEKSILIGWLLDGKLTSSERIGRLKGWMDQGLNRVKCVLNPQTQTEIRSMLDECPEPRIQPLTWVEFSKRGHPAGEGVYRTLSGLLHGRVWSVVPAFTADWDENGFAVTWRGYPLSLHRELAECVDGSARNAMQCIDFYYKG